MAWGTNLPPRSEGVRGEMKQRCRRCALYSGAPDSAQVELRRASTQIFRCWSSRKFTLGRSRSGVWGMPGGRSGRGRTQERVSRVASHSPD